MEEIWLVKADDMVWGDGSPGVDVEIIISVCTSEEKANEIMEETKKSRIYSRVWTMKARTNELLE